MLGLCEQCMGESPITMLVTMESIQNRIIENGKKGIATWLYIDEFHVLLRFGILCKVFAEALEKSKKKKNRIRVTINASKPMV